MEIDYFALRYLLTFGAYMSESDQPLFKQVEEVINKDIRPFIEADGGIINLKDVNNGTVFVKLAGACAGCPGAAMTLRGGVERILMMKLPDVKGVEMVW